jgi:hypothetical protein
MYLVRHEVTAVLAEPEAVFSSSIRTAACLNIFWQTVVSGQAKYPEE